ARPSFARPGRSTTPNCSNAATCRGKNDGSCFNPRRRRSSVARRAVSRIVGMNVDEILARLKSLGDDARRAHNERAGAPANQFGVKLGDIRAIAKEIKSDHQLALDLWVTSNVEAQLLATLIVKPKALSAD